MYLFIFDEVFLIDSTSLAGSITLLLGAEIGGGGHCLKGPLCRIQNQLNAPPLPRSLRGSCIGSASKIFVRF